MCINNSLLSVSHFECSVHPHPPPSPSHHGDPHHSHGSQYENSPPPASPSRGFINRRPSANNHPGAGANIKVTMTKPYHDQEMETDGGSSGGGGGRVFEANTTLRAHPFRRSFKKGISLCNTLL